MAVTKLAFVDCETSGLNPEMHDLYEIGLILDPTEEAHPDAEEITWWVRPDLAKADPTALRIGRYYERRPYAGDDQRFSDGADVAQVLAECLDGRHLVGAVPSFDAAFLERFLRRHGQCPTWHYHLICVEALAAGFLAAKGAVPRAQAQPPWDSSALSELVGVNPGQFDRHTALGDARWARAIYQAVMGGRDLT